jgi:exopolysaccharide biosynthesis polyprenyl glycosylphosphotransferase
MFSAKPVLMHTTPATIPYRTEPAPSPVQPVGDGRLASRSWFKRSLLVAIDQLAITGAHRLAEFLTLQWLGVPLAFLNPAGYYLFYAPFFTATVYFLGAYKNPDLRRPEKELELVTKAVTLYFVALTCANFLLFKSQGFSRYLLVTWYVLALGFLLAARFTLRGVYAALWKRGLARQRALLAGPLDRLAEFQRKLAIQRYAGYELVGLLTEPSRASSEQISNVLPVPVLGRFDDAEEIAERCGAEVLLVCLPVEGLVEDARIFELVRSCQQTGIEMELYSDLFTSPNFQYERHEFSGSLRFTKPPVWSRAVQRALKKCFTFGFGLIGSLVALLLTPIVALLLKWEDGGPVFYRREFVDCDGQVRHYLKFRTMVRDADRILHADDRLKQQFDAQYKLEQDPRVLRVGRILRKYSLDEFPQFFSLLTGRLALVGPRVISQEETSRYEDCLPRLLSVKPGITGYWQVMGRQTTTYNERIQMDMFYIEHWSFWLDLIIIGKTFWKVLRAEGAY